MKMFGKWFQKWVLDAFLSNPPPLYGIITTVFISVFTIGYWCAHWMDRVDMAFLQGLNIFSDNIGEKQMLDRLSYGLPIDVVYTWVNGSDPEVLEGLRTLAGIAEDHCQMSHCVQAPYASIVYSSSNPETVKSLLGVETLQEVSITHNKVQHNYTIFPVQQHMDLRILSQTIQSQVNNTSAIRQAFWTSDVGGGWGIKQPRAVILTGAKHITDLELLVALAQEDSEIRMCTLHGSLGLRVLECLSESPLKAISNKDSAWLSPALSDSGLRVRHAMLMLQRDNQNTFKETDINRFEDNEELRYSLRSLEKFAPWVRHVYLVTNGQIPYWLNLDHSRLTIVTHEEIFANKSHLPTYSSPAIEAHLHRIPGLSEHFLYLNDDVMLGSEIWPEDFFSTSSGYKVFLSWSLPECSSGCPGSWLGDGYCDTSCNTSACDWDGGDCDGGKSHGGAMDFGEDDNVDGMLDFCASSCSDLWLSDKYCDQACNVGVCGYDGGDCGVSALQQLHQLDPPTSANTTYVLPKGVVSAWMNISSLQKNESHKSLSGSHSEVVGLRSLALNTAQGVVTLVIKRNITEMVQLQLDVKDKDEKILKTYMVYIKCNSVLVKDSEAYPEIQPYKKEVIGKEELVQNFTFNQLGPKLHSKINDVDKIKANDKSLLLKEYKYALVNVNNSKLPEDIIKEVMILENLFIEHELTLNGLIKRKSKVIEKFSQKNDKYHLINNHENEWPPIQNIKIDKVSDIKSNSTLRKLFKIDELSNIKSNSTFRKLLWSNQDQNLITKASNNEDYENIQYVKKNSKWIEEKRGTLEYYEGNLPWEKNGLYKKFAKNDIESEKDLEVRNIGQRQLLDMFAESLLHVNRLYNSEFGYQARRVPAHMPHLINKNVMGDLQERFAEEFELTSSHRVRQANDMQYAFSYFFFLMSSKIERNLEEVFNEFDTDNSGTWSDREIRTFLSRYHDLPLHYSYVQNFHKLVENCSAVHHVKSVPTPAYERYADSDLPTVSLELVMVCDLLSSLLKKQQKVAKYRHTQHNDEMIHFKMISSNVSTVVHHLDEVRKNPRKFICLNSNLDPASKDNELIHALVQDTYESLFPKPSSMELPLSYRNRFLHIYELREWKHWRNIIRALIYACLASLIMLTLINFFSNEIESLRRKWCRRKRRREGYGTSRV